MKLFPELKCHSGVACCIQVFNPQKRSIAYFQWIPWSDLQRRRLHRVLLRTHNPRDNNRSDLENDQRMKNIHFQETVTRTSGSLWSPRARFWRGWGPLWPTGWRGMATPGQRCSAGGWRICWVMSTENVGQVQQRDIQQPVDGGQHEPLQTSGKQIMEAIQLLTQFYFSGVRTKPWSVLVVGTDSGILQEGGSHSSSSEEDILAKLQLSVFYWYWYWKIHRYCKTVKMCSTKVAMLS